MFDRKYFGPGCLVKTFSEVSVEGFLQPCAPAEILVEWSCSMFDKGLCKQSLENVKLSFLGGGQ